MVKRQSSRIRLVSGTYTNRHLSRLHPLAILSLMRFHRKTPRVRTRDSNSDSDAVHHGGPLRTRNQSSSSHPPPASRRMVSMRGKRVTSSRSPLHR